MPTTSESGSRSVSITIDSSALRHNLALARRLGQGCRQFATIKADAYGHGAVNVMRALSNPDAPAEEQADGFAVVTIGEAIALREAGANRPILVLQGPQRGSDCAELLAHDLWPVIHDLAQHEWFCNREESASLTAWLKVDTGMGRLGVDPQEVPGLLGSPSDAKHTGGLDAGRFKPRWMGVMSHLACADSPGNAHTKAQIDSFDALPIPGGMQRSLANSAAVLAWPATRHDWARPGLMLYGCNPLENELPEDVQLKPAMRVTAPLISVKKMAKNAGVGYAQAYRCPEAMTIGLVGLGYGDGLPRVLNESATVSIAGVRCPVIGRVSMDSIAVDLRKVPEPSAGQFAELWGPEQPVEVLSKAAGTINYELLTQIRGKRHCSC